MTLCEIRHCLHIIPSVIPLNTAPMYVITNSIRKHYHRHTDSKQTTYSTL